MRFSNARLMIIKILSRQAPHAPHGAGAVRLGWGALVRPVGWCGPSASAYSHPFSTLRGGGEGVRAGNAPHPSTWLTRQ
jgi:hypothetical protein